MVLNVHFQVHALKYTLLEMSQTSTSSTEPSNSKLWKIMKNAFERKHKIFCWSLSRHMWESESDQGTCEKPITKMMNTVKKRARSCVSILGRFLVLKYKRRLHLYSQSKSCTLYLFGSPLKTMMTRVVIIIKWPWFDRFVFQVVRHKYVAQEADYP